MTNFFKRAPVQENNFQKQFLEASMQQQHLVAGLPLGYSAVSLYALSAMMGNGLCVMVCPDARTIQRNYLYLAQAGFNFPDVAVLNGNQSMDEEKAIEQQLNKHQIRLLYTTPERFASLTFLNILVHANLTFVGIEEAERLLPGMPGYGSYSKAVEALEQLRILPPITLFTPPLPAKRRQELSAWLRLSPVQFLQNRPDFSNTRLHVHLCVSERQKFNALSQFLMSDHQAPGRLSDPGSVLIKTHHAAEAEKLGQALRYYGFDAVHVIHSKKDSEICHAAIEALNTEPNTIVVSALPEFQAWRYPPKSQARLVFWTPPNSMDELGAELSRFHDPSARSVQTGHVRLEAMVLHARDDYQAKLKQLSTQSPTELDERTGALQGYRRWVLSTDCYLQGIHHVYQDGYSAELLPACGHCRNCIQALPGKLKRLLRHWIY